MFRLDGINAQVFNSDALPLAPLDLSKFVQTIGFNVLGQNDITLPDHWFTFNAKLIGMKEVPPDTVPVPEPSSVVLTLTGLAAIARRGRTRLREMRWE